MYILILSIYTFLIRFLLYLTLIGNFSERMHTFIICNSGRILLLIITSLYDPWYIGLLFVDTSPRVFIRLELVDCRYVARMLSIRRKTPHNQLSTLVGKRVTVLYRATSWLYCPYGWPVTIALLYNIWRGNNRSLFQRLRFHRSCRYQITDLEYTGHPNTMAAVISCT